MVTASKLQSRTSKELAQIAKSEGVRGWHAMRKAELVQALLKSSRSDLAHSARTATPKSIASASKKSRKSAPSQSAKPVNSADARIARRIRAERERQEKIKDLSISSAADANSRVIKKDRMVLIVRDAWWCQAYWEITTASVQRARVALGQRWHLANAAVRLFEVTSGGNTNSVEQQSVDVPVSGDAHNWFINVPDPTKSYRAAIGYLLNDGQFHVLAKSNVINMPAPEACGVDDNWADISVDPRQFFVLSGGQDPALESGELQPVMQERTKQHVSESFADQSHSAETHQASLTCQVDAEMLVFGSTQPSASVTIGGQTARVQPDGSFALRASLPDRRQVLPVVVTNRDGTQQQTVVLAVERNTKTLDLLQREPDALL